MRAYPIAVAAFLLWAGPGWAVCGPGPNTTTIPSRPGPRRGDHVSPHQHAGTDSSGYTAGRRQLRDREVPGSPSTCCTWWTFWRRHGTYIPGNGIQRGHQRRRRDHCADNYNDAGEAGETLDGEISGVVALNSSLGNSLSVRVGVTAFASGSVNADMGPTRGRSGLATVPAGRQRQPGAERRRRILRTLRSRAPDRRHDRIVHGEGPGADGTTRNFVAALTTMNATLAGFPVARDEHRVLPVRRGVERGALRRSPSRCRRAPSAALNTAVAAGTKIKTVGVGADADPLDLTYIANHTGGTFIQVTRPERPGGGPAIDHAERHRPRRDRRCDGAHRRARELPTVTVPCRQQPAAAVHVTATCVATDEARTTIDACITLTCYNLCGNNVVDGGAGEECDPPNTPTCDATCQRVPDCGDTFVDAPEQCEPPNGAELRRQLPAHRLRQRHRAAGRGVRAAEHADLRRQLPARARAAATAWSTPRSRASRRTSALRTRLHRDRLRQRRSRARRGVRASQHGALRRHLPAHPGLRRRLLDATELCDRRTATCDTECPTIACGNNLVQPGEECEPPNTATCDAICQRVPTCGERLSMPPKSASRRTARTATRLPADRLRQRRGPAGRGVRAAEYHVLRRELPAGTALRRRVRRCAGDLRPRRLTCDSDCTLIECGNGQVEVRRGV